MKKQVGLKTAKKISRKIHKLVLNGNDFKKVQQVILNKYGVSVHLQTIEASLSYHDQMEWLANQAIADPDGIKGFKTIDVPEKGYPCAQCDMSLQDRNCDTVHCAPNTRKDGRNVIFVKE